jgi:hypothetical protein
MLKNLKKIKQNRKKRAEKVKSGRPKIAPPPSKSKIIHKKLMKKIKKKAEKAHPNSIHQ